MRVHCCLLIDLLSGSLEKNIFVQSSTNESRFLSGLLSLSLSLLQLSRIKTIRKLKCLMRTTRTVKLNLQFVCSTIQMEPLRSFYRTYWMHLVNGVIFKKNVSVMKNWKSNRRKRWPGCKMTRLPVPQLCARVFLFEAQISAYIFSALHSLR